jgi:hypothetical protein
MRIAVPSEFPRFSRLRAAPAGVPLDVEAFMLAWRNPNDREA